MENLINRLLSTSIIALDIETINWWNRHQERIALIQLAYRSERQTKVAVIDGLAAELELETLRSPLELNSTIKVIHNAVFDASRLRSHFHFNVGPIHDTMLAARRGGEKRYSLQAQAETHLNLHLDKGNQRSDWSRRPLAPRQLHYAALDAFSTLLLYENQVKRRLNGAFQLKQIAPENQPALPLLDELPGSHLSSTGKVVKSAAEKQEEKDSLPAEELSRSSLALLGIITELSGRYHPDQLAISVGSSERVGMTGWIVDRVLGPNADLDEETAKLEIANLCRNKLAVVTEARRLEATTQGAQLWQKLK